MTIRKATPADAALLAELGRITFLESHGHSAPASDIEAYVQAKYTVAAIEALLANTDNHCYILETHGVAAGYSVIQFSVPAPVSTVNTLTKLDRIYLLNQFQDKQLGRSLFEFNLQLSKQAGEQGMWLYTWVENHRAIRFYEKQGFIIAGSHDFRLSPTHTNPNHLMLLMY